MFSCVFMKEIMIAICIYNACLNSDTCVHGFVCRQSQHIVASVLSSAKLIRCVLFMLPQNNGELQTRDFKHREREDL